MSMKDLIAAIKADLQGAATLSYVADTNIFIVPDEDIVPQNTTFPAIGLKDGHVTRTMESSSGQSTQHLWDVKYHVHVILYVDMVAGEVPVIGQASPAVKGILAMGDDVDVVLHEDYQSITGINDAYCIEESASEIIGGTDMIVLKKRLTYEYSALETH